MIFSDHRCFHERLRNEVLNFFVVNLLFSDQTGNTVSENYNFFQFTLSITDRPADTDNFL